jgi:hypothetical protein
MKQDRRLMVALGVQLLLLAALILIGWIAKFSSNVWHTIHVLIFSACVFIGLVLLQKKS